MKTILLLALACTAHGAIPACATAGIGDITPTTALASGSRTYATGSAVAVLAGTTGTFTSVTDPAGNTYTPATIQTRSYSGIWYVAKNITGFTGVVTLNTSNAAFNLVIPCEITGIDTGGPLDVDTGSTGFPFTTYTSPSFTTAQADEIILLGLTSAVDITFTAGAGYTIPTNGTAAGGVVSGALQYKIVSGIQTGVTASMDFGLVNADIEGMVISLKAPAAAVQRGEATIQ